MIRSLSAALGTLALSFHPALPLTVPLAAQDAPSPGQIVAGAAASEWVPIPAEDLLVMTLAPDRDGTAREVVIQLMPAPFSQGWIANIRTLARAGWYDGISINRVQDNYVVQWGDANYDNPEAEGAAKPLPNGLRAMDESDYVVGTTELASSDGPSLAEIFASCPKKNRDRCAIADLPDQARRQIERIRARVSHRDAYAEGTRFFQGWPVAFTRENATSWPVHCYGMVGVGRGMSPDTGSGAELYTVIGHAPRHLDRNIALVGRVISGIEQLSSLPRGAGDLGFYTADEADERTPIASIRVASDLPVEQRPEYEYLSTDGESFARYDEARANRRDPFFIVPAGGADICNIPVPVRAAD